jgi:hypothetical protein
MCTNFASNQNITAMKKSKVSRFIDRFNIAGFTFWDGYLAIDKLRPGVELQLVREDDNGHDPQAVAIYLGEYKLGFIPRDNNSMVSKFLDLGYTDIFELRVQSLQPEAIPERQVYVALYLREAKKEDEIVSGLTL